MNKTIFYLSEYVRIFVEGEDRAVITLASLQKMEERLPAHFMRVHRSYIVNLRKITEVSRLRIIFDKNTYIPVGDNYKEKLRNISVSLVFPKLYLIPNFLAISLGRASLCTRIFIVL